MYKKLISLLSVVLFLTGCGAKYDFEAEHVKQLQEKFRAGNLRQTDEGLVLRIVADTLPEESKAVESGLNLEDVYMYYFE